MVCNLGGCFIRVEKKRGDRRKETGKECKTQLNLKLKPMSEGKTMIRTRRTILSTKTSLEKEGRSDFRETSVSLRRSLKLSGYHRLYYP